MPLDRWLRLSSYGTLALSCAALIFAEAPFLPDLEFCLAPMLGLLLTAWWLEGRWSLPAWGANVLGLVIAAAGAAWLVTQLTDDQSLLSRVPLHLAMLPYMGPLVMAALLVKVFRPRDQGDFWRLQGLGLVQIGLGCVLEGGPAFGGLLALYFVSAIVCLTLHHRRSTVGERSPPSRWRLALFTLRWTVGIAALTLIVFLLTPRRDSGAWEPLNDLRNVAPRIVGENPVEEINLNDTGRVELDDEIVLRVAAADALGRPKRDLPADQRWRGFVLDWYENGRWTMMHPLFATGRRDQADLPDLGEGQFYLTYTVLPRQPGNLVLAEPIELGPPNARLPVVGLAGTGQRRLFHEFVGSVQPLPTRGRREVRYRQVVPRRDDPARASAHGIRSGTYLERLTILPRSLVPTLHDWTIDLLRRLARQPQSRLPARVRADLEGPSGSFLLDPDDFEAVARVLSDYLAFSGEYTYTLDMVRVDWSLDPVLDFLTNVRQGHCERYATALALMLRSVGIPARIVKGFRGVESEGEGNYVVRRRRAHAWVEVLLAHGSSRAPSFEWLSLDPTPAESGASQSAFSLSHFWEETQRFCLEWWRTRIVDYNADEQADLWYSLKSSRRWATWVKIGLVAAATVLASFVLRLIVLRLLCHRPTAVRSADDTRFYRRFVRLLERYASMRPSSGQTPREYGAAAQDLFQKRSELSSFAAVPTRVVDLFYRVRFGGQRLSEEEQRTLDTELDRLAQALQS